MTCDRVKPLLSEFADETLDVSTAWQIQTHLAGCEACHELSREFQGLRGMLHSLPVRQPSAQFEASLAQRLAFTRRPETQLPWRDRLSSAFPFGLRLRPALALGFALSSAAAFLWLPIHPSSAPAVPAAHGMDQAFVADCVAQHRREAAAEPLADLAAQNLAGHLDNTASPVPAASDTGLF